MVGAPEVTVVADKWVGLAVADEVVVSVVVLAGIAVVTQEVAPSEVTAVVTEEAVPSEVTAGVLAEIAEVTVAMTDEAEEAMATGHRGRHEWSTKRTSCLLPSYPRDGCIRSPLRLAWSQVTRPHFLYHI